MANNELSPFLDEIRNRLRLSDLIGRSTKIFRKGRAVKALCPFHNEKTPSFGIEDDRGVYHCFGCGVSGDHFTFVQAIQNISFIEAVQMLAEELGIKLPEKENNGIIFKNDDLIKVLEEACVWYQENFKRSISEAARLYLEKRQINQLSIDSFRLGYAPNQGLTNHLKNKGFSLETIINAGLAIKADDGHSYDRFRNRVIFPIINVKNQVIAFGGRILDKGEAKYINSPETPVFQKRYVLYGFPQARKHMRGKAIVVEGYMDVIRLHQEGIPCAVAPLGTALGIEHLQQLWRHAQCPIIAFDGDIAGEKAAFNTIDKILPFSSASQSLKFLFLPEGEDPDSYVKTMGRFAFEKLLDTVQPIYSLLWQKTTKDYDLNNLTPEEFLQIKNFLREYLKVIGNKELRFAYIRQFDGLLHNIEKQKIVPYKSKQIKLPQQNNITLERTLLVTLINHAYLWEEVGELLMGITFKEIEEESYRQAIIEYFAKDNHNKSMEHELPSELVKLNNITDERFYSRVPFAKTGYDQKMVKSGWIEAYNKLHKQQYALNDQQQRAQHLKNEFNILNWQRLKATKEQ